MNLNDRKWKEFRIEELFEKIQTKKLPYKAGDLKGLHNNTYCLPALTAGTENHGLSCYVPYEGATVLKNCISVASNGAVGTMYYQDEPFTILQDSYAIQLKPNLSLYRTKNIYCFIISCTERLIKSKYNWNNKATWPKVKQEKIFLPVIESSDENHEYTVEDIDFEFMENYISQLEAERISQLEAYLSCTGLDDYELTDEDREVLGRKVEMREFVLNDLFYLENGNKFDKNKMTYNSPSVNFVSRTANNNGISDFVDKVLNIEPFPSGCLTLAFGGSIGSCFLQDKPFYTGQNVGIIKFKDGVSSLSKIYIKIVIEKVCKNKFVAFGDEINKHFKTDLLIRLPIIPHTSPSHTYTIEDIDFNYMEKYIRAIEKQTVKGVYEGSGRVIKQTKNIAGGKLSEKYA